MHLPPFAKDAGGGLPRTACVLLHAAVCAVFLALASLHWAHEERKWTFPIGHIERNRAIATSVLSAFGALVAVLFASIRQSLSRQQSRHWLDLLYLACLVILAATAPQSVSVRPTTRLAASPNASLGRVVVLHNAYDDRPDSNGVQVSDFLETSHIRDDAYYRRYDEAGLALNPTPGLIGNVVHDAGSYVAPDRIPGGRFNASATQFSVTCAAPGNLTASVADSQLDADPSKPYSTITLSMDVPGRGSIRLVDVAYNASSTAFGLPFHKANAQFGYSEVGQQWTRFPKAFNATGSPASPDYTTHGDNYDRTAARSGIDDDLSNTIFFYIFRHLPDHLSVRNPESYVPPVTDRLGQYGSMANVTAAKPSVLVQGITLFDVQAVACVMSATTFDTTVSHLDNSPDLSAAPVALSERSKRNSSWAAFQPHSAAQNAFEETWAQIFTPLSAPPASSSRSDNYSIVPGFFPLTTLESYMSGVIAGSAQLAALESALENITALAYWGLMQEYEVVSTVEGPAPEQPIGVAEFNIAALYLSFAASIALLLLALLSWRRQQQVSLSHSLSQRGSRNAVGGRVARA